MRVYTMIDGAFHRTIKIYGPSDKRAELEPRLVWATPGQRGFPGRVGNGPQPIPGAPSTPAYPMMSQTPPAPMPSQTQRKGQLTAAQIAAQAEAQRKQLEAWHKAAELKQMLNNLEKVDDEGRRSSLLDTLCSVEDILSLPLHPNPPGIEGGQLKVNLLKHQVHISYYV